MAERYGHVRKLAVIVPLACVATVIGIPATTSAVAAAPVAASSATTSITAPATTSSTIPPTTPTTPTTTPTTSTPTAGGSAWTATATPLPADASGKATEPEGISCPASTWCVAVGGYVTSARTSQGLLDIWSNGTWTAARAPLPGDAGPDSVALVNAVSCPAIGSCVAVGRYNNAAQLRRGLLLSLSGGKWTAVPAALPPAVGKGKDTTMLSVSCPQVGHCVAAGRYTNGGNDVAQGILDRQNAASWVATNAPLPADTSTKPYGGIDWVSCPAADMCSAIGAYVDKKGARVLAIDALSGTSWSAARAPCRLTRHLIRWLTRASSGATRPVSAWQSGLSRTGPVRSRVCSCGKQERRGRRWPPRSRPVPLPIPTCI